jgi:3-hydroxybutyryl-CoA dehydrogenase
MLSALGGFKTYLYDLLDSGLEQPLENLRFQMQRMVEKKTITSTENKMAFARLHVAAVMEDAVSAADLIIESVDDNVQDKQDLFTQINILAPQHSIIAVSSATALRPNRMPVSREAQLLNINFYNPPFKMHMVEIVTNEQTSAETAQTMVDFVARLNKKPVLLRKEVSGLLANRLLGALLREALLLLEEGVATHEEIDFAATEALGHPMGPFELLDMTGIDVNYYLQLQQYEDSGKAEQLPSRILQEKLDKGELGRKTGRGFYSY